MGEEFKMSKEELLKNNFFNVARLKSLEVNFRARVGACLVKRKRIISIGKNKPYKTHPMTIKHREFGTVHAELDCMIGINRDIIDGSTIYLYRETSDKKLAMSKPCPMCENELITNGVKKVFYTTKNGYGILKLKIH